MHELSNPSLGGPPEEHHQHTVERLLCEMYQYWCDREGLPAMSADELLVSGAPGNDDEWLLTPRQRNWVRAFLNMWEANDPYSPENV